jgi:hypothetical protein
MSETTCKCGHREEVHRLDGCLGDAGRCDCGELAFADEIVEASLAAAGEEIDALFPQRTVKATSDVLRFPVTRTLLSHLGDWSDPVQLRIVANDDGTHTMEVRSVPEPMPSSPDTDTREERR